ncbi:RNA polymerase sigma factor, partial [Micromonospora sp.]|uniref:RNA polymerase sigma factor n=1 Tax=Micromonospora sp. TaxID=1876 RepID=UPI003B3AF227
FDRFYRTEMAQLVSFLVWRGVNRSEAADIAQDAMFEAFKHWNAIRHPGAWVRRVASRLWARHFRANRAEPLAEVPEPDQWTAQQSIDLALEQDHVRRLVAGLPIRQRQILLLILDGYTPAEIAEMLQVIPASVRSSLRHARRALRGGLQDEGLSTRSDGRGQAADNDTA